jgi:predicted ester cyclase
MDGSGKTEEIMNPKDLAKRWYAHIDAKELAALKGLLDPKHSFRNPMTPAPVGAEEHLGMMQMMTSALKGEHILDRVVAEGGYVAVSGRWHGTHVGEFNGVPATGNKVEFTFMDMLHIENGKITDEHLEMNPMAIMAQIGAKG